MANLPVCWHPWQICHRYQQHPAKLVAKFAGGVFDTGGKFAPGVVDTGGAPWIMNISANFRKNMKWPYCYFQGLGGRWFMKKSEAKNRVTISLEGIVVGKSQHYFYCFPNGFLIWMIVSLLLPVNGAVCSQLPPRSKHVCIALPNLPQSANTSIRTMMYCVKRKVAQDTTDCCCFLMVFFIRYSK